MAQKPNSNNSMGCTKDSNEMDLMYVDDIEPINSDTKKNKTADMKTAATSKQSQKPKQSTTKGGSPRTQRSTKTVGAANTEKPGDVVTSGFVPVASSIIKETYASKFGTNSSNSNSSSNSDASKSPSSVAAQKSTTSNSINSSTSTNIKPAIVGVNSKAATLPAPRPLMSQVINPPACKLNEVHQLQQKSSFSDTVKKTVNEVLPSNEKSELSSEKSSSETTISTSIEGTNKDVVT